jgi:hypothetical protein
MASARIECGKKLAQWTRQLGHDLCDGCAAGDDARVDWEREHLEVQWVAIVVPVGCRTSRGPRGGPPLNREHEHHPAYVTVGHTRNALLRGWPDPLGPGIDGVRSRSRRSVQVEGHVSSPEVNPDA